MGNHLLTTRIAELEAKGIPCSIESYNKKYPRKVSKELINFLESWEGRPIYDDLKLIDDVSQYLDDDFFANLREFRKALSHAKPDTTYPRMHNAFYADFPTTTFANMLSVTGVMIKKANSPEEAILAMEDFMKAYPLLQGETHLNKTSSILALLNEFTQTFSRLDYHNEHLDQIESLFKNKIELADTIACKSLEYEMTALTEFGLKNKTYESISRESQHHLFHTLRTQLRVNTIYYYRLSYLLENYINNMQFSNQLSAELRAIDVYNKEYNSLIKDTIYMIQHDQYNNTRKMLLYKYMFAIERYINDHGQAPDKLEQLVPTYTGRMPKNPAKVGDHPYMQLQIDDIKYTKLQTKQYQLIVNDDIFRNKSSYIFILVNHGLHAKDK